MKLKNDKFNKQEKTETSEENKYECYLDNKTFPTEKLYIEHFRKEHKDDYPFYCYICKKGFLSEGAINNHCKSKNHQSDYPFYCDNCGKGFLSKNAMDMHIDSKHNFKCKTCGKIFSSKQAMNAHCKDKNH